MDNGVNEELKNKVENLRKERKRKECKNMISLWVWMMAIYAIFASVAIVLIKKEISIDENNQWNWGWTILSIEFLHFALSLIRTIGPKSLGAVLLFGRPLYQVKSGWVYVPFLICQLVTEDKTVITIQFPAEPEKVDKSGLDDRPVSPGFVKPIRVTTASIDMISEEDKVRISKNPKFLNHPLNEMMTLEPSVVVRFQIRNDDFISFLTNIGSRKKAVSAMRDTVDSVLNIEFPKRTPALIIMDKAKINGEMKTMIEVLVGEIPDPEDPESFNPEESWGLNVINARLVDLDLSKTINQSLRDIIDSQLKKTSTITQAEGKKKGRELEGEGEMKYKTDVGTGDAKARLALLEAEATGLEKIAKVAETEEGKLAVVAKVVEKGLEKSQYSIIPGGPESFIAGIMETLKKTASRDKAEPDKKTADDSDKLKKGGKK